MKKLIKYFTSGLFLCLTISAIVVGQDFSATLNVAGGISGYDLTFGFNPDATDGYDEGIDTYAPPAPPPPAFDAALSWGGDRYYTQILAGDDDLSEHVYDIALAYGADNLIIVTWDNTGWSDMMTSCVLQDAFGGLLGIDIDMLAETSLSLDNPAFNTLKLKVTPTDYVEPPSTPSCVLGDVYVSEAANQGDPEDYIEIYNSGSEECSLAGFQLDDEQPFDDFTFGDVVLAPGAFWLGYEDAEGSFGSGLGSDGDVVYFGDADGNVLLVTLEASVETVDDIQLSQSFDAGGTGCYTLPTPGEANADCFTIVYGCTDSDATNYNPDANVDDDSCEYAGLVFDIVINEIFYNGSDDVGYPDSTHEFFELYNNDTSTVDLSGYSLTQGVDFTFPAGSSIASGEYIVVTVDTLMYTGNGYQVFQWTDGALSNSGEDIELTNLDGSVVDYVDYDDSGDWPGEPDGDGPSLELINPALDNNVALSWQVSSVLGGTPGAANSSEGGLFFSEAAEGSSNNKYLEIYNGTDAAVSLADYRILGNYNGNPWSEAFTFADDATLESGDVYVIANSDASDAILSLADEALAYGDPWYTAAFNGDDVRALAHVAGSDTTILDIIGTLDGDGDGVPGEGSEDDPGDGFDVAGVSEATKDHTLVRKDEVMSGNAGDWASSAGTNEDDSEYIVAERPTADYTPATLGWHIEAPSGDYGCNDSEALNYDSDATGCSDDPTDFSCCDYYVPPTPLTIYEIQGQADATPYVDVFVSTSGVVTGVTPNGFWLQDGAGAWNGVWVYGGADTVAIGDNVTAVGTVIEYYDLTEIMLDEITINSTGNDPPALEELCTGCFTEAYESVLVVTTGECDNNDLGYGEWSIDDGSGPGMVDDKMYAPDTIYVGHTYRVAGPLDFAFGNFKIQPRDENDVVDVIPGGSGPDFSVSFDATASTGTYTMTVGFSPGATDGYDDGIDSYAPPAPPPPAFDAALTWSGLRYYTQILNGSVDDLVEHEYGIALAYGTDNLIELSWDNTGWSDLMSSCVLQDAFGGLLGIDIDMLTVTSLTLNDPAFNALILKVTPAAGSALSVDDSDVLPEVFALHQNYPNPFNPVTTLHYHLPEQATVNIIIYDMLGRMITQLVSAKQEPGYRSVQWDATDSFGNPVSAGIYLYQIQAGEFVQTRKMVLLK